MDARAAISANPFFAEVLDDAALAALARRALMVEAQAGTELIHEDDSGSSLFIIVAGEVEVVAGGGARPKSIARLGPGEFFGEMSLMTGARRSATVRALTAVTVMEITQPALAPILDGAPDLVERFAAVLQKRQTALDRAYGHGPFAILDQRGFTDLIRSFFGGSV